MIRFFKIVFKRDQFVGKKQSVFFRGKIREDGWFFGQRINKNDTKPISLYDYMDKEGVEHLTYELIHPDAVEKWTEYYDDLKYGGLTWKALKQQIKNMESDYHQQFGEHSGIPRCCITFFNSVWNSIRSVDRRAHHRLIHKSGLQYKYIPCPSCLAKGLCVRIHICNHTCGYPFV